MTGGQRPTRATVAGRTYLDLQNLARRQHRPTDELHQLYALEGFLSRLVESPHAERLVLKGGVLLAAYDARRPTRDVDMQARAITGDRDTVLRLVCEIAALVLDDGLVFDTNTATAQIIRDEDAYSGVRITLTARLASARLSLHVDVNVGDPIWPAPCIVALPRLLGGAISLRGYPLSMVYAEKITTALQRGTINTRWRDFADLYLLTDATTSRAAKSRVRSPKSLPTAKWNCRHSRKRSTSTPDWRRHAGPRGVASNSSTIAYRRRFSMSSTLSLRSLTLRSSARSPDADGTPRSEPGPHPSMTKTSGQTIGGADIDEWWRLFNGQIGLWIVNNVFSALAPHTSMES